MIALLLLIALACFVLAGLLWLFGNEGAKETQELRRELAERDRERRIDQGRAMVDERVAGSDARRAE